MFRETEGLDLNLIRNEVSFPIHREKVVTEEGTSVDNTAVVRKIDGEKKVLGLVSQDRMLLPYADIMDWMVEEFQNSGTEFKLRESSLIKGSTLFQQYIFDGDIQNPDGYDISPMVIMKASYTGTPLKLDFGTFRFVCSNGVTVGETISSLKVKSSDLPNLLRYSLREEIKLKLQQMTGLTQRYNELQNVKMDNFLTTMILDPEIPSLFKKDVVYNLESKGIAEIGNQSFLKGKHLSTSKFTPDRSFNTPDGEEIFRLVGDQSAWNLYNDSTEIATHRTRNEFTRMSYYNSISRVFAA